MKYCKTCNISKPSTEFHKDKTSSDGLSYRCKNCKKQYNNANKDIILQYHKDHYDGNKNEHKHRMKIWYDKNKDKSIQYHKDHYNQDKEKHAAVCKRWRENKYPRIEPTEDELRLKYSRRKIETKLRSLVKEAIKRQLKNSKAVIILGCTIPECRLYLESQFKPEMNWGNYGIIWEIDHIVGCCKYDLFNIEQQKQCFHYTNLQPLFKTTEIAESFGYIGYIGNKNKIKK
jgi:hypothetical protein